MGVFMKSVKILLVSAVFLWTNLFAGWLEDQSNITTEEVLTPEEPVVIEETTIKKDDGWTGISSSEQVEQKALKTNFIGLINGKSYGSYAVGELYRKRQVKSFYASIGYVLYWFQTGHKINSQIKSLVKAIEEAPTEALDDLQRYHYDEIVAYVSQIEERSYSDAEKDSLFKTLDILLTDAFFNLAHDLKKGVLDYDDFQEKIKSKKVALEVNYKWETPKSEPRYSDLLVSSYTNDSVKKSLYNLVNHNLVYERLKEVYEKYKSIAELGGWNKIPQGKILRYGSKGKRVDLLAKRLSVTGDLSEYHDGYNTFDKKLKDALKYYQKRMGLWVSGTLTAETRRSLNISAKAKVKLIKLNIEKARWEKASMHDRVILVNIPDFMLRIFDDDRVILASRVVCGKKTNPTPIFSSTMSYVVLNPTWTVPDSIIKKEMIPKFKENPNYLEGKKFKIYNGWGKDRKEVDPTTVDWSQYEGKKAKVPFAFVRARGEDNPLGIVKFMFPNNNAVYIHDTPSKSLFKKRVRAFSHGCIRLHNPKNLLEFLANEHMNSGFSKVDALLKKGDMKSVGLDRKLPVYIRYYTVFVTDDGTVKFAYDIYGYDKILIKNIL